MNFFSIRERKDLGALLNRMGKNGLAVEVGTWKGHFAAEILKDWQGEKLILVDSWCKQPLKEWEDMLNYENDQDGFDDAKKSTERLKVAYGDRVEIMHMKSLDAVDEFLDETLDFVYIDANHSYESVTGDLNAWFPKVKFGGVIGGHDYENSEGKHGKFAVKKAVDEFVGRYGYNMWITSEFPASWFVFKLPMPLRPEVVSPWQGKRRFEMISNCIDTCTCLSKSKRWVLFKAVQHAMTLGDGEFWDCGAYLGGSTRLIAETLAFEDKYPIVRAFDTFAGMSMDDITPQHEDLTVAGAFSDVNLPAVKKFLGGFNVRIVQGRLPETFKDLDDCRISFCNLDVGLYKSTKECLEFVWPRMMNGGIVVVNDFNHAIFRGVRQGCLEFFHSGTVCPIALETGQALLIKRA